MTIESKRRNQLTPAEVAHWEQKMKEAMQESEQRKPMTHIDVAIWLQHLRNDGKTVREIAKLIQRGPRYVQAHLRLLELPKGIQGRVHRGEMSMKEALSKL